MLEEKFSFFLVILPIDYIITQQQEQQEISILTLNSSKGQEEKEEDQGVGMYFQVGLCFLLHV
ncbi:MAG: hypothetical protein M5E90_07490 [Asgard group archaeon]|nr:hypothetical protein [Asgard group archaeon]